MSRTVRLSAIVAALLLLAAAGWLLLPELGGGGPALALRAHQMELQRELAGVVRGVRDGGWAAAWPLIGVSFLYGVVHAAGPGHGKAVIGAYVLADGRRLRRGLGLAWASAMLQAVTAVTLIAVAVWAVGMTAREAQGLSLWLERAGYALVLVIGAAMLWRGAARLYSAGAPAAGGCGHAHHHHDHHHHAHGHHEHEHEHEHGPGCGHVAAPPPDGAGWREAAALVLSVGIRPCSGALLVLTFASAMGVFAAGVASAFAMAVGTAITVSLLAVLAAGSRRMALAAAAGDARWSGRIEGGLVSAAGLALAAMGALFLIGSFAPGPAAPFR